MNLESIATYLDAQGIGQKSKTIYVNDMPTDCKEGILLRDNYNGTPINHYMRGHVETSFRVAIRALTYSKGYVLAQQAKDALQVDLEQNLGPNIWSKQCLPANEPRSYRRSVGGYWEFEIDVDITYTPV